MILVDSSVWISYFKGTNLPLCEDVNSILLDTCICGIVLQEVLQGVKNDKEYRLLEAKLQWLPYVDADRQTYLTAADIYRVLRKKGKTVLAADALIAALAVENSFNLYTLDVLHFNMISEVIQGLRINKPGELGK